MYILQVSYFTKFSALVPGILTRALCRDENTEKSKLSYAKGQDYRASLHPEGRGEGGGLWPKDFRQRGAKFF